MLQTNARRRHVPSLRDLEANHVSTDLSTGLSPPQGSLSDTHMFRRAVVHLCRLRATWDEVGMFSMWQ